MTTQIRDAVEDPSTLGPDAVDYERYGALLIEDGTVVIYELDGDGGWIQSDAARAVEDVR